MEFQGGTVNIRCPDGVQGNSSTLYGIECTGNVSFQDTTVNVEIGRATFAYGMLFITYNGAEINKVTVSNAAINVHVAEAKTYNGGTLQGQSTVRFFTPDRQAGVDEVVAGVLLGKEAFGGYGSYPFHPAAVGYVVAAVSWPEQVFLYPQPYADIPLWDPSGVVLVNGMSSTLRNGGLPTVSAWPLVLGEFAAPMGAGAVLILLACGLFLFTQKDLRLTAAISFLAACAAIVFFFPRQADLLHTGVLETAAQRLNLVKYELVSGATLYSAVLLISEPYTCPRRALGRVLYGLLLGCISMSFRYFGVYETGACFAILIVNSLSGWLDRVVDRVSRAPAGPALPRQRKEAAQ